MDANPRNQYSFSIKSQVPQTILQNSYVTLGREGFLRATGASDTQYLTHEEMRLETIIFGKLKKIRLFRYFKHYKYLHLLKYNVTYKKRNEAVRFTYLVVFTFIYRQKLNLEKSLFSLNTFYRELLDIVMKTSLSIMDKRLVSIKKNVVYEIFDFVTEQSSAQEIYSSFCYTAIDGLVEELCRKIQSYLQSSSSEELGHVKDVLNSSNVITVPMTSTDGTHAANITSPRSDRSIRRNKCRQIASFFRMVDFRLRDSMHSSAKIAFEDLLQLVRSFQRDVSYIRQSCIEKFEQESLIQLSVSISGRAKDSDLIDSPSGLMKIKRTLNSYRYNDNNDTHSFEVKLHPLGKYL